MIAAVWLGDTPFVLAKMRHGPRARRPKRCARRLRGERTAIVATSESDLQPLTEIEYRVSYLLEAADATREETVSELEGIQRAAELLRQREQHVAERLDRIEALLEGLAQRPPPVARHSTG
jgi:hypothetical protein